MYYEQYERVGAVVGWRTGAGWHWRRGAGGEGGLSFKRCSAPLANLHNGTDR